jgi:Ca2+-binding EF-hand superfamily protein
MEISAFLDKKLSRRFGTYDNDGDGYIEREDFELAARRTGEEFGLAPAAPARQRLTQLLMELWQHLATVADADADGKISEAEYKAAFAAGLLETPESFDQGYVPFLEALMDVVDTDGDGKLTVDDHIRWTRALMNLPEDVAREAHRRTDTDGDGYYTTRELLESVREFYFDEDPSSAGSWALGPLEPAHTT